MGNVISCQECLHTDACPQAIQVALLLICAEMQRQHHESTAKRSRYASCRADLLHASRHADKHTPVGNGSQAAHLLASRVQACCLHGTGSAELKPCRLCSALSVLKP